MFKRNKLEFEISDNNILSVSDFDWYIDRIDAIYVRHSEMGQRSEYAIFIQQGSEIVELYFRSKDEMIIAREFKKLCTAIKEIRPLFDNSAEFFVLINYANVKYVGLKNKFMEHFINLEFNSSNLSIKGNKKKYNTILTKFNDLNKNNTI